MSHENHCHCNHPAESIEQAGFTIFLAVFLGGMIFLGAVAYDLFTGGHVVSRLDSPWSERPKSR